MLLPALVTTFKSRMAKRTDAVRFRRDNTLLGSDMGIEIFGADSFFAHWALPHEVLTLALRDEVELEIGDFGHLAA